MRIYLLLIFTILLCISNLNAQGIFTKEKIQNNRNYLEQRRWSWGFYLGFNSLDFKIDKLTDADDILTTKNVGFNVGLIGNFKINKYLDIRLEPGVFFSNRDLNFTTFADNTASAFRETRAAYVYVPLVLKFSTKRLNNFKPFLTGGIGFAQNLSSNEDSPDDNSAGQFRMKTSNYMYEVGFGVDFYLEYFKFTPTIKGVFALNNELVKDNNPNSPWTSNIDQISTRGIFINLMFQ